MRTTVFIDHCAWDLFFKLNLDISQELPKEEFGLLITREAEFEIKHTPDVNKIGHDLKPLKIYIQETIDKCGIQTDAYFGFFAPEHPLDEQRAQGFDHGRFITYEEIAFRKLLDLKPSTTKKLTTKLYNKEADISLAARSLNAVVLTLNNKQKEPFYIAQQKGGKIIFLNDFEKSDMPLKNFIKERTTY